MSEAEGVLISALTSRLQNLELRVRQLETAAEHDVDLEARMTGVEKSVNRQPSERLNQLEKILQHRKPGSFEQCQEAASIQSFYEFQALWEALDQYIQNTEDVEEDLDFVGKKRLDSARSIQARLDSVFVSLAEEGSL